MRNNKKIAVALSLTVGTAGIVAYLPAEKVSASTPAEMQQYYDEKITKETIDFYISYINSELGNFAFQYLNADMNQQIPKELYSLLEKQAEDILQKDYTKYDNGTFDRMIDRGRSFMIATQYVTGVEDINIEATEKMYYIRTLIDAAKAKSEFHSNKDLQIVVYEAQDFVDANLFNELYVYDEKIQALEQYVGKITMKESNNSYLKALRTELTADLAVLKEKNEKEISPLIKTYNDEIYNLFVKQLSRELTFETALILKAYINTQRNLIFNYNYVISENLQGIERWIQDLRENLRFNFTTEEKQYFKYYINEGEAYLKAKNYTLNSTHEMDEILYEVSQTRDGVPSSFVVTAEPSIKHTMNFSVDQQSEIIAEQEYKAIKITANKASNATPATVSLHAMLTPLDGIFMMKNGNTLTPVGYTVNDDQIELKVTRSGELVYVKDAATPLKDVKGNFYEKYITQLSTRGIVSGYQNKFTPDKFSTRAEFFTMLGNGLGISQTATGKFEDAKGKWYDGITSSLAELGYVQGAADGIVNGEASITRQEAFTVIGRLLENQGHKLPEVSLTKFKDANEVADYAAPYVQLLMELGIVEGGSDGNLHPKEILTKGQMAKVLVGVLKEIDYL